MAEEDSKNVNEWTAKQQLFIEWLSMPSIERIPLTQGGFAEEIGVREETLSRWKRLEGWEAAVKACIMERFGDALHDVIYSFKREAKTGSFQHQKMYLEMLGLYREKSDLNVNMESALPDDALIAKANAIITKRTQDTP